MKFAILGIGKTGQAMACYLKDLGHDVTMWDRKAEKTAAVKENGITANGYLDGTFYPDATSSLSEAVSGAQYIFVMTLAEGHLPIAEQLSGSLVENQRILIHNGNWGAIEFHDVLGSEAAQKNVIIAETGGMIILADSAGPGFSSIKQVKTGMAVAGIPKDAAATVCDELAGIFTGLTPCANVLETSINNSNPILHVPISLLNITRIENGEDYTFYGTASTRLSIGFAERADDERVAVAEAIGITGESCLSVINSFWEDKHPTLYDALKKNPTYQKSKGPSSLDFRYLTEDLPYGIVPIVKLGRKYGVQMPCLEMIVGMFSVILGRDYMETGPDLDRLDISAII